MPPCLKTAFIIFLAVGFSACAPRMIVKPIPADTPPEKVLEMVRAKDAGLKGLRASVKVTVQTDGKSVQSFDAVLYAAKPDRVRLTGLAMMGVTVFDIVLTSEKFYFYQPSDGYLYTGRRAALKRFLDERGVKADPDILYKALFFVEPDGFERYMVERSDEGYKLYLLREKDGVLSPKVIASEYDLGLTLKRKVFYDALTRQYLSVVAEGAIEQDGYSLPESLKARDTQNGYTVTVAFDKYIVNPEDMDSDFTIQGGEFKGIREVE